MGILLFNFSPLFQFRIGPVRFHPVLFGSDSTQNDAARRTPTAPRASPGSEPFTDASAASDQRP